jgi:hypothetical protein
VADCEHAENCVTFYEKLANMPSTSRLMRGAYCKGEYADCARYKVSQVLGWGKVPPGLSPSDDKFARELIG